MSKLLVRVQSPDGTKRIEVNSSEHAASLYRKTRDEFKIDASHHDEWFLYLDRNRSNLLSPGSTSSLGQIIKHGDLIYLFQTSSETTNTNSNMSDKVANVEEDEVDQLLAKQDGKIIRGPDEQLCHHGPQGKCINCIPLEPFDLDYLATRDPPIKYMSFHSYLKKLQSGADKGKYTNLEELNCKIKPGCKEHPPWPKGICNKCQPNTVYLNRQPYRHVDNIMFENGQIVEKFLDYWRKSGNQRVGYLIGRYEPFEGAPLGIKAVVSAIYEPPQESTDCSVDLIWPDPNQEKIDALCQKLGLKRVGWILTDLMNDETQKGPVKHFRGGVNTYYLTAEECYTAAYLQNMYRNVSKYSSTGVFGSKFVTVVVSGDENNQIHFAGFQVSNQCMALVGAECMVPTIDAPELAYIKESSNEQYIPDVYFREKDKYGNEVTKSARPLPVEYLIVDLPAAFAKVPTYTFYEDARVVKKPFPIENRKNSGQTQSFESLANYLKQFSDNQFLESVSNFHVLVFLVTNQTVHIENSINGLLEAIRTKNSKAAELWSHQSDEWQTIQHFISTDGHMMADTKYLDGWTCSTCTYINATADNLCQICSTPKTA